uniref:hypothetical protein n=1 Tax=Alistipes shahii TaxID=328814 RepID=UPI003FEF6A8D
IIEKPREKANYCSDAGSGCTGGDADFFGGSRNLPYICPRNGYLRHDPGRLSGNYVILLPAYHSHI